MTGDLVEPGSALAGDARKSPSLQVAHAAWSAFTHGVDHLHALRGLIVEARMIHNHAPLTLIRSAMESAGTAVWLLEPRQRGERLRRRLKLAHDEAKEAGQVHKLFLADVMAGKRWPRNAWPRSSSNANTGSFRAEWPAIA